MEVTFMELVNLGLVLKMAHPLIIRNSLKPIYQLYIRLQSFNDTVYFNDADYRIITICKWMAQCKQIYFDTCFKNFPSRIE